MTLINSSKNNILSNATTISNNKEILLISLLEKLCKISDPQDTQLFQIICEYLHSIGIISNYNHCLDHRSELRELYSKYILDIIKKYNEIKTNTKTITSESIEQTKNELLLNINSSRYLSDFIELEFIGEGGFGSVYKAFHKIDQTMYAIKKIIIKNLDQTKNMRIFKEVQFLASLNHKNVVRYYSTWIDLDKFNSAELLNLSDDENSTSIQQIDSDDALLLEYNPTNSYDSNDSTESIQELSHEYTICPVLYIQQELCKHSLAEYIKSRNYKHQQIILEEVNHLMLGILKGLHYIHSENILHRDINTSNIFVTENGTAKIGDFGISTKLINDSKIAIISDEYGTALYRPPEQLQYNIYTTASDIYSVGIIYFELINMFLTESERIRSIEQLKQKIIINHELATAFPSQIETIIKMTSPIPDDRPIIDELKSLFKK